MIIMLLGLLVKLIDAFLIVLFIRYILSWFAPNTRNSFTDIVYQMTTPLLEKCKVLVPIGSSYLDLSYIIIYIIARILKVVIVSAIYNF